MLASSLFGKTLRDLPSDVEFASHGILVRAGYIRQLSTGIYSLLPLAAMLTRRIEAILREEMVAIGGQEVVMPVVQPADLWVSTGRYNEIDDTMVRFSDRRDHPMVLAMTHEEVVAELCRSEVRSWRDLPRVIFQIQTKFRDEKRPRGGLIRTREFVMKDSYSLCADDNQLDAHYLSHARAYFRIAARAELPVVAVASSTGEMGGSSAHEFTYLTDIGEDVIVRCPAGDYYANIEVAEAQAPSAATTSLQVPMMEEVPTPGATTIDEVAAQLGLLPAELLRSLFLVTEEEAPRFAVALAPGDREFNELSIAAELGAPTRRATAEEVQAAGIVAGFGSPVGVTGVNVLVDVHVRREVGYVVGANRDGFHLRNAVLDRDVFADQLARITKVKNGDRCIRCDNPLELVRGVEYGNIFKLGTKYTEAMRATFTDESGNDRPVIMGSYGIGVGRLLACIAEEHHDERGLVLPASVSPFACSIVAATEEGQEPARMAYDALRASGVAVLLDDRPMRAGAKFADSDLWGFPLRITASKRSMEKGGLEITRRRGGDPIVVPREEVVERTLELLAELATAFASALVGDPALVARLGSGD